MKKSEILKCKLCGKEFVNVRDIKTGKISKYIFKPTCKCMPENVRVSVG